MSKIEPDFIKSFVYHVSHDLKAPVRHIREFYRLFIDSLENDLTDEQKEFDKYIQLGISNLSSQLDGMLKLSRVNTSELHYEAISLCEVFDSLVAPCSEDPKSTAITVQCDAALSINTDRRLLDLAINEIIDNALKFKAQDRPSLLFIKIQVKGPLVSIQFEDNGIGIPDESSADPFQPFQPFQRYSNAIDFPGIGIGLSIVKFICIRLGGDVAMKKNEEQGVVVTLNLPK